MSNHFNIDSVIKCIGCPIKLIDNMTFYGFCLIISVELQSPLVGDIVHFVSANFNSLEIKIQVVSYCMSLI